MSRGGIVIPDSAQEKSQEGEIVAIGPGRMDKDGKHEVMSVKVGDRVVYPRFGGTEIKIAGEDFVMMPENQILAKIV
jgi:chaperonin GroES